MAPTRVPSIEPTHQQSCVEGGRSVPCFLVVTYAEDPAASADASASDSAGLPSTSSLYWSFSIVTQ